MTTSDGNPLLQPTTAPPPFDQIEPQHVEPAISKLLERFETELAEFEAKVEPTWNGLVEPLERLVESLRHAWGAVGHLMGVRNSPELRAAHEAIQPRVVAAFTRLGQSQPCYAAALALRDGSDWDQLDEAQQRIVDKSIRDAVLSGVGLKGEQREQFNKIKTELAELATKFSNNVLDATGAFSLTLTTQAEADGLPQSLRQLAAQSAREKDQDDATAENGPWRITLDQPSVGPFLQHSKRRDLREQVYRALIARAGEGEHDNRALIAEILERRDAMAKLLGFDNYAAMSLSRKMADSVDAVGKLLEELRERAFPAAQRELDELRNFARSQGETEDLVHWDVGFWAERMREEQFAFTDEELRPYFPLPRVLDGLFALASNLFEIEIVAADGEAPVWHPDVRFFRIKDRDGKPRAAFYLDPFSRPKEKRGGAWMDECMGRSRLFPTESGDPVRLPIAYLVCNGTPPIGDQPSLMTFREVETLFHEFGHGLQHMLTTVDFDGAAGISGVEWDAVELPSQFMENWCYHRPTLLGFSGHWETGAPLPDELFKKIVASRTYRSGSATLRQLHFGLTDLALHHNYDAQRDGSAFDVQRRIADNTTVLAPLPDDRFLCSFSHIFAGGYAAGYYSYKWAEVLSADAFGAFEEVGLDNAEAIRETGRRFRDTVLALGGSRHPMLIFQAFRGRKPSTEALLRHTGLAG